MPQYYNNFSPFGQPMNYVGNQPGGSVKVSSWLTPEEQKTIKQEEAQFSLSISKEDHLRGICNHRHLENGDPAIRTNSDGTSTCLICGHTFRIDHELTKDEVQNAVNVINDILQTTKLMYVDMPAHVGREFYQILPFINKIPQLYEMAAQDFKKYEGTRGFTAGVPQNAFAIFGSMTNPSYGYGYQQPIGAPMMPQGGMAQPYQQPQQFYQNPQMGQFQPGVATPMNGNPFYQQPQQFYQNPPMAQSQQQGTPVQQQGYSLNQQGAAAPKAPVQNQEISQATQPGSPVPTANFKAN